MGYSVHIVIIGLLLVAVGCNGMDFDRERYELAVRDGFKKIPKDAKSRDCLERRTTSFRTMEPLDSHAVEHGSVL